MALVNILIGLAVIQYVAFASLVGRARGKYGVKAPATTGHEVFERYYRVQMNTLELLAVLLPGAWLAVQYRAPGFVAAMLAIYLVGRMLYLVSYVANPAKRGLGFMLSMLPALILVLAGILGALWEIAAAWR
jgi:glutathione S-transferase